MITFMGMRVVVTPYLTEMVEDWSQVRSPSRAMRRRAKGHRQNILLRQVEKPAFIANETIFCGPAYYKNPMKEVEKANRDAMLFGIGGMHVTTDRVSAIDAWSLKVKMSPP